MTKLPTKRSVPAAAIEQLPSLAEIAAKDADLPALRQRLRRALEPITPQKVTSS
jgi:hypothetical protein